MRQALSPKHPQINIPLVGEDGNAFSILGRVMKAMRRAGLPNEEWETFHAEATSGNYDNLLVTVMRWFSVDMPDEDEENDEERWYEEHPYGCYDCREIYAQGGCPSCGF